MKQHKDTTPLHSSPPSITPLSSNSKYPHLTRITESKIRRVRIGGVKRVERIEEVQRMLLEGKNGAEIAKAQGVSRQAISQLIKRYSLFKPIRRSEI